MVIPDGRVVLVHVLDGENECHEEATYRLEESDQLVAVVLIRWILVDQVILHAFWRRKKNKEQLFSENAKRLVELNC